MNEPSKVTRYCPECKTKVTAATKSNGAWHVEFARRSLPPVSFVCPRPDARGSCGAGLFKPGADAMWMASYGLLADNYIAALGDSDYPAPDTDEEEPFQFVAEPAVKKKDQQTRLDFDE